MEPRKFLERIARFFGRDHCDHESLVARHEAVALKGGDRDHSLCSPSIIHVLHVVSSLIVPMLPSKMDALNLRTTCRALALNRDLLDHGFAIIPTSKTHSFLMSFNNAAELLDVDHLLPHRVFYSLPHVAASVRSLTIELPERESMVAVTSHLRSPSYLHDMTNAINGLLSALVHLNQLCHLEIPVLPTHWLDSICTALGAPQPKESVDKICAVGAEQPRKLLPQLESISLSMPLFAATHLNVESERDAVMAIRCHIGVFLDLLVHRPIRALALSMLQDPHGRFDINLWAHQINRMGISELTLDSMIPTDASLIELVPTLRRLRLLRLTRLILQPNTLSYLRDVLFPSPPDRSSLEMLIVDTCTAGGNFIVAFLQHAQRKVRVLDASHLALGAGEIIKRADSRFPNTLRALTLHTDGRLPRNTISWVGKVPPGLTHVSLTDIRLPWSAIQMLVNRPQLQWAAVKPGPDPPVRGNRGSTQHHQLLSNTTASLVHSASAGRVPAGLLLELDWELDLSRDAEGLAKMATVVQLVRMQDPPTLVTLHFRIPGSQTPLQNDQRIHLRYRAGGPPMLHCHSLRPMPPLSASLSRKASFTSAKSDHRDWSAVWSLGRRYLDKIRREQLVYDAAQDACVAEGEAGQL